LRGCTARREERLEEIARELMTVTAMLRSAELRNHVCSAETVERAPKIVGRLQAQAAAAMREPTMAARMKQLGMVMEENGTANYVQFMKYDMERYAQAVKKLNLQ
jgi:NADP-dependent 3-hydroxy acid dehydrogenase YdfG